MEDTECLTFCLQNYYQMQQEFNSIYDDFFDQATSRLKRAWVIKLDSMKMCNHEMERRRRIKQDKLVENQKMGKQVKIEDESSFESESFSSCESDDDLS